MDKKQKMFLIKYQDVFTLQEFGKRFKIPPSEVYEVYDEMLESGEYFEHYFKFKKYRMEKRYEDDET